MNVERVEVAHWLGISHQVDFRVARMYDLPAKKRCQSGGNKNSNKGVDMSVKSKFSTSVVFISFVLTGAFAAADDHPYSEGPVVNISSIRTVDGHFEEYMKFVSTTWKQEQEAAKKMGDVLSYEVLTVEPRGLDDPDLYLVITFKNWAALDGSIAKNDAIAKSVSGSVAAADKGLADRASIRRILGSQTMQTLILK